MATYIDFSAAGESALDLAQYVNKLRTKGKEADETWIQELSKLAEKGQIGDLLAKLADESALVLQEGSEKEIESFFLAMASLLLKQGENTVRNVSPKLLKAVSALPDGDKKEQQMLRIRILTHFYNIFNYNKVRYDTFMATLQFVTAARLTEVLVPQISNVDDFGERVDSWQISPQETKDLYKTVLDIFRQRGVTAQTYRWTVRYLSKFGAGDSAAVPEAAAAALDAIKAPDLFQFDALLELPAVQTLKGHATHGKLYELLQIFVRDSYDAYSKFIAANPTFLSAAGLDADQTARKIRLLSLATLGAAGHEIPYAAIAAALRVGEAEVESWVIAAITEKVLAAKIDQLRRVITVTRSLQRVFTKDQWKQLAESLTGWRTHVKSLLATLHEARAQARSQVQSQVKQSQQPQPAAQRVQ